MASIPEPTVVLYKSNMCGHCTALTNIWDTQSGQPQNTETVTSALKKVYPKLRFHIVTARDNTGRFDENHAPKDLIRYGKWYPMILLIPGRTWDAAMSKLGPKNDVQLFEGIQVMNGIWEGKELKYAQKYDIRKPTEFARWLRDALDNEEFKRVNNGPSPSGSSSIVVPRIQNTNSQPIQPLLTNIVRPGNTTTNYASAGHSTIFDGGNDICSMRIISRPK